MPCDKAQVEGVFTGRKLMGKGEGEWGNLLLGTEERRGEGERQRGKDERLAGPLKVNIMNVHR